MADDGRISSFDDRAYTGGRCRLVFSENLAQEADEWDKEQGDTAKPDFTTSRVLLSILQNAALVKASHIHLGAVRSSRGNDGEFRVRYRIGGRLWEADAFPLYIYPALGARLKINSGVNPAERRVPQFGRFLWIETGTSYEMRFSSVPAQFGETFVLGVSQIMGKGSYAEARREWQDKLTVEEIYASIVAKRQGKTE